MSYWQLFYHLVWPTRGHAPLLNDALRPLVHGQLRSRAVRMGGTVYAVGGTATHVHLAVAVPPRWSVASFVGQLKSQTTQHILRANLSPQPFAWQETYGALSFERRRLPVVVAYVERQPELHTAGTLIRTLELVEGDPPEVMEASYGRYYIESETWRNELLQLDAAAFELG